MPFSPQDVLVVSPYKATGLKASDLNNLSDPYVVIKLRPAGEEKLPPNNSDKVWEQKTSVVMENLNPSWNDENKTFHSLDCLDKGSKGIEVIFEINDYDRFSKDDFLGSASWSLKSEELEYGKEYEEMLPLRDGKKAAGILFVKITISKDDKQGIQEQNFKLFKPFKKFEYCLPKDFSMTSSNDTSNTYLASFVNLSNGVSFETVLKEFKEKVDFSQLAKKIKGETITSLKKKYTNVELMAIRENILPSPHSRNKQIEQIFEFDIYIEYQLVKMWETIRVIRYNNNFVGVFTYGGKDEVFSLKNSVEEIPFLSESIIFQ